MTSVKTQQTAIPWFGEIPKEWSLSRIKNEFKIVKNVVGENSKNFDLLSLTLQGIKYRDIESGFGKFPAEFNTYQIVKEGNLVFCLFDIAETPRTIGLSDKYGMITGAYTILKTQKNVFNKYFYYLFLMVDVDKKWSIYYSGLRNTIKDDKFKSIPIPLPPLPTQKSIANYLDKKTTQIKKFIEDKQEMIEFLKEQKQAIIHQAVTKGIEKNVKMKDSGIEWLGEIPAAWEVVKLKFLGKAIIGLTYSPKDVTDENNGILVLRSSNLQNGKIEKNDNVYVKTEVPEKLLTRTGDILICSRNGSVKLVGKNALIDDNSKNHTFGAFTTVFRTKQYKYLHCFFNSNLFSAQSGLFSTSTINQLTTSILNNMEIPLPKSEKERNKIIQYIEKESNKIDTAIAKTEQEIELIEEYKKSLIYHAVTGKITV